MTSHRFSFISPTLSLTLAALAAVFAMAPSALAGSLLSGYGGPGSGAQALLGSTLVNGGNGTHPPGSGTQPPTNPPGGSATSGGSGGQGQGQGAGAGTGGAGRATGSSGAHGKSAQGTTGAAGASNGSSAAYTPSGSPQPAAGTADAADTGALGFTGADVLLLALVLGALALTAGLTTRLARTQDSRTLH